MNTLIQLPQIVLVAFFSSWTTYLFGIRKLHAEAGLKLKEERYRKLIETLCELLSNKDPGKNHLRVLNETYFFASDSVVREVLKFNKLFTKLLEQAKEGKKDRIGITAENIKPLVKAIRIEFGLRSESLDEEEFRFFQ